MVAEISDDSMRDYGDTLVFAGTSLGNIDMDYAADDKSMGMNTRYVRVEAAADKYGDEYCRKAIDKYLYDESDTRTPDEFIDDLNRGTENVEN